jgi:cold shock protein
MDELELYYGVVIWFSGSFGFIEWSKDNIKQKDMFIHYSDISADGFRTLFKGQKVSFNLGLNKSGEPKAINVVVLKN